MKHFSIVALPVAVALLAALSPTAHAQTAPAHDPHDPGAEEADRVDLPPKELPKNVVLADLGLHVVGAGYQRTVAPRLAISLTGGLYQPWTTTPNIDDVRGAYLRVRPYFFVTGAAPRGLWLSPFFQAGYVHGTREATQKPGSMLAAGLAVGYAFLLADHLHLSLGAGGQWHRVRVTGTATSPSSDDPSFSKLGVHVDGTLGYAF